MSLWLHTLALCEAKPNESLAAHVGLLWPAVIALPQLIRPNLPGLAVDPWGRPTAPCGCGRSVLANWAFGPLAYNCGTLHAWELRLRA